MLDVMPALETIFNVIARITINAMWIYIFFKVFQLIYVFAKYRAGTKTNESASDYYHDLFLESDKWMRANRSRRSKR